MDQHEISIYSLAE